MRYSPVKPYVMMSRDNPKDPKSKMHPHVIVGRTKVGFVSVCVTHSPTVKGLGTVSVPDNIQRSYVVDRAYERQASDYEMPNYPSNYGVSASDEAVFRYIAAKTRKPLK